MSTTFPLPLECLQLVIHHLANSFDGETLATLLRVNKYVCSATLPILYSNPFRIRPFKFGFYTTLDSPSTNNKDIIASLFKLIRVLLLSLHDDKAITDLLRVAYLQQESRTKERKGVESTGAGGGIVGEKTSIPYYTFLTKVDFEQHSRETLGIFHNDLLTDNVDFNDYQELSGNSERYLTRLVTNTGHLKLKRRSYIIAYCAAQELRRDLTWALCTNAAEHIQELVVPISDVARHLALVPRYKVLSSVTFLFDSDVQPTKPPQSGEEKENVSKQQARRAQDLEDMISFAQEHRRLWTHTLNQGRCTKFNSIMDECPKEYQHHLLRILPPLINPVALDERNWEQFVANIQETDISLVKDIKPIPTLEAEQELDRLMAHSPFLHRCRALESIQIRSVGNHTFQWAVNERKWYDVEIAAGRSPQRSLVPISRFVVDQQDPSFGHEINNAIFAFQGTLQSIVILASRYPRPSASQPHEFAIGDTSNGDTFWSLPRLSTLTMATYNAPLYIHPTFLQRCPYLTSINLDDMRGQYSLDEVVHWEPAKLPLLASLTLRGNPAISFHPDTLKHTPGLFTLELGMIQSAQYAFIPPVEEFDVTEDEGDAGDDNSNSSGSGSQEMSSTSVPRRLQRPVWTWDWELPKLVFLTLNGEFAYRFQFMMFNGTPSLRQLLVDIHSSTGNHPRTIGITDFIKPEFQHPTKDPGLKKEQQQRRRIEAQLQQQPATNNDHSNNNDENWRDFAFVHAPALQNLTLSGPWTVDGSRVLEVLFDEVAPGIETLSMPSREGSFDLAEWVSVTSRFLQELSKAYLQMRVTPEMLLAAGLVVEDVTRCSYGGWQGGYPKTYVVEKLAVVDGALVRPQPVKYTFF